MPDQTGNPAASRALDVRLSVPAEGDLRQIAGELAARVSGLASTLANGGGHAGQQITFEFRQVDGELVVQVRCNGMASEVRQRLPV